MKKLCIIASIDIWKDLRYSIHLCLALEEIFNNACSHLNHESICQSIDNNEFGCGIFIDLKLKAFDTVNHATPLTKFNHYGIGGNEHFLRLVLLIFKKQQNKL